MHCHNWRHRSGKIPCNGVCSTNNFLLSYHLYFLRISIRIISRSVGEFKVKNATLCLYMLFCFFVLFWFCFFDVVAVFHQKRFLSFLFLSLMKYQVSSTKYDPIRNRNKLVIRTCQWTPWISGIIYSVKCIL